MLKSPLLGKHALIIIFFTKLYTLLSVDSSTNRRNEIIFGGDTISIKYGTAGIERHSETNRIQLERPFS